MGKKYSEAIAPDGAVILCDNKAIPIDEILSRLNTMDAALNKILLGANQVKVFNTEDMKFIAVKGLKGRNKK